MTEKNSFILYTDMEESLSDLSDEELGKLMRAIFAYVEFGIIPSCDGVVKIAFRFMKTTLDRDKEKWKAIRQERSEAGKKGAEARWSKEDDK